MGFCGPCTVPCELAKLDVEGNYSGHLANPEVVQATKDLYMALGKLGTCEAGEPEVDMISEGTVNLLCRHPMADGPWTVMGKLGDALVEHGSDVEFDPPITYAKFEDLPDLQKEIVARIIAAEQISAESHGINEASLAPYLNDL